MAASEHGYQGCAAAEGRQEGIQVAEESEKYSFVRFFVRHVVELEKQLRMGDQHGFFQNIKLVQLE